MICIQTLNGWTIPIWQLPWEIQLGSLWSYLVKMFFLGNKVFSFRTKKSLWQWQYENNYSYTFWKKKVREKYFLSLGYACGPQTGSNSQLKVLSDSELILLVKRSFLQLNVCYHKAVGNRPGLITNHLAKILLLFTFFLLPLCSWMCWHTVSIAVQFYYTTS